MKYSSRLLLALVSVSLVSGIGAAGVQANFTAASYPVTVTATSTADEFKAFGSVVKCTENSFTGTLTESSSTLKISPSYKNCKFGTLPATVEFTSCYYDFTHVGPLGLPDIHVLCAVPNDTIHIRVYPDHLKHTQNQPICHLTIKAQTPNTPNLVYTNESNDVKVSGKVSEIVATQERTSAVCPAGTETKTAEYIIQPAGITVQGIGGVKVDVG
jgi:hypothetical protein